MKHQPLQEKKVLSNSNKQSSNGGIVTQMFNNTTLMQKKSEEHSKIFGNRIIQKKSNGLPDNLRSGIESLSGIDMSNVKVHYNSSKPTQLNAFAFAQGNSIHLGSGQEKHLPHEAWHIVQQKQGRVKPTTQMKGKIPINDDIKLEREADIMGIRALKLGNNKINNTVQLKSSNFSNVIQRRKVQDKEARRDMIIDLMYIFWREIKIGFNNKFIDMNSIDAIKEEILFQSNMLAISYSDFSPFVRNVKADIENGYKLSLLGNDFYEYYKEISDNENMKLNYFLRILLIWGHTLVEFKKIENKIIDSNYKDDISEIYEKMNSIFEEQLEENERKEIRRKNEIKEYKYVKTKKERVIIRTGSKEKSSKSSKAMKSISKGDILLVEKSSTKLKTGKWKRKKESDYYLIKEPKEYEGLWIKAPDVEETKTQSEESLNEDIIITQIVNGTIASKKELDIWFKNNNISLEKQYNITEFYREHRKEIAKKIKILIIKYAKKIENAKKRYHKGFIDEAHIKKMIRTVKNDLPYGSSFYDEKIVKNALLKIEQANGNGKAMDAINTSLAAYDIYAMVAFWKQENKLYNHIDKSVSKTATKLVDTINGPNFKNIFTRVKELFSGKDLDKILEAFGSLAKDVSFTYAIEALGFATLIYKIKVAYDAYKVRKIFEEEKNDSLKEVIEYGKQKVKRAFISRIILAINSLMSFISKILALLSGGTLALFSGVMKACSTAINFVNTLYRKARGLYKWAKGTRGVNRIKHATTVVDLALKGDKKAEKFLIKLVPELKLNMFAKIPLAGSPFSDSTEDFFEKLKEGEFEHIKKDTGELAEIRINLIEQLADAMKSQ